ncbi:response regulator [Sedimenticola hydrogenitrophicus]|uniref:response regulator n=1 Tax=Sedimenticola hydrogenitrophicus TaxID=2967975 RepID=UPI0021A5D2BC|nr:response regulator [Sedimenticola hydrogenitrophicus]
MTTIDHILIVDDDPEIRELLATYLTKSGYRVSAARDGRQMWQQLERNRINLVVLDVMLPGEDGLILCRNLRGKSNVPIIMLTARGEEMDRILGLEMGADDYLPKPFNPRELQARIKALLWRARSLLESRPESGEKIRFSGWTLDTSARHLVAEDGVIVSLSGSEYKLLRIFLDRPRRVLSRDQLMGLLEGRDWTPDERTVDIQISRLRKRLREDAREPQLIKTVRGEGYVLSAKVEPA